MIRIIRHCAKGSEKYKVILYPKRHYAIGIHRAGPIFCDAEEHLMVDSQTVLELLRQFKNEDAEFVVINLDTKQEVLTKDYNGFVCDFTGEMFISEMRNW